MKRDSKYNLIVQENLDKGDSCHRFGSNITGLLYLRNLLDDRGILVSASYLRDILKYEVEYASGIYVRHPDKTNWASRPDTFSRDQTTQLMCAMTFMKDKVRFNNLFTKLIKNFGMHPNTQRCGVGEPDVPTTPKMGDIINPSQIGLWIRVNDYKLLYPILTIIDIGLIVDSLIANKDTWDRVINLVPNLLVTEKCMPTLASKLAINILNKDRAKVMVTNYFSIEKNGIPDLGHQLNKCIDKLGEQK